jgi:hypothetical protein
MILGKEWQFAGRHNFNTLEFCHVKEVGHESPRIIVRQFVEESPEATARLAEMLTHLPFFLLLCTEVESCLNDGGDPHLKRLVERWSEELQALCQK